MTRPVSGDTMEGDSRVASYDERIERLRAELESDSAMMGDRRADLRNEILTLFKEIEQGIADLEQAKERVRPLVDRYRELFARPEPVSSGGTGRIDHLGSSTYRERGWSALAGADYERAVRELEKAIGLDPENASNLALLAWAHLRLQDLDKAGPLLQKVLDREPDHALARTCLGYLRLRETRYAEAIENLSAVVREGTDRTASLYANLYLGIVYAERDMHRDAQSFFRRALELGPNLIEAYWELGRSHQREGRDDLALAAWKTGAENRFNPWGERCKVAAERLEAQLGTPPV